MKISAVLFIITLICVILGVWLPSMGFAVTALIFASTHLFAVYYENRQRPKEKEDEESEPPLTPEEWENAKREFIAFYEKVEKREGDKQTIICGGRTLSINELIEEVRTETELGKDHIQMYGELIREGLA